MFRLYATLRRIPSILVFAILALAEPVGAVDWQIEAGSVALPATDAASIYVAVEFRQAYDEPPVVMVLSSSADSDPVAVRVRGVTATGFELVQVEPGGEDGPHGPVEVHYLAVEPGVHIFEDGTRIEAGRLATNAVQHGKEIFGKRTWDEITYTTGFFAPPVVLADLQTTVNEIAAVPGVASEPWLVVAVRGVTGNGFEVALERAQSAPGEVVEPETVGWVAIEAGAEVDIESNDTSTILFETLLTEDRIKGWNNGCRRVDFTGTYGQTPLVVGHQDTHDGRDGGWLRRCSSDAAGVDLAVDEDRFIDDEREHTKEVAGLAVAATAFDAVIKPPPVARLVSPSARVAEGGGSVTLRVILDHEGTEEFQIGFAATGGTATAGTDFDAVTGTVVIPAGQVAGALTIPIFDDGLVEGAETFVVMLTAASGGFLGAPVEAEVLIGDDDLGAESGWRLEADLIVLPASGAGSTFVQVVLRQAYAEPPVVVLLASSGDEAPVSARIRNVTTTGFEIVQVEPGGEDGPHGELEVHYLAAEAGEHLLEDGTRIEVGTLSTTVVQHGKGVSGAESWEVIAFGEAFSSPPVVLAGLQTTTNEGAPIPGAPSEPWLVVAIQNVTENGTKLALERSESAPGEVNEPETIGWVAIDAGTVSVVSANNGAEALLETVITADKIKGWENGCKNFGFAGIFSVPPLVIGHQNRHDGNGGSWLRRCAVDEVRVGLAVDEDRYRDEERLHTSEAAGLVIAGSAFDAVVNGSPPAKPEIFFAAASTSVGEGDGSVVLTVNLSAASAVNVSVGYATTDGAADGADYTSVGGTVVIPAGQTNAEITIQITDDSVVEGDEAFSVSLSNPNGASLGLPSTVPVIIVDDDFLLPSVLFASSEVTVGEFEGPVSLTVVLSAESAVEVTVDYITANGTATAAEDYTANNGMLTIPAGELSGTITVPILDDAVFEGDEDFSVSLNNPEGATLGTPATSTITITDDEGAPTVALASSSTSVGESDGSVILEVELSVATTAEVTVNYTTADGTATAAADYTATSGMLTIPAGQTNAMITTSILDDPDVEDDEDFTVSLSNPQGATLGTPSTVTITILSDDLQLTTVGFATDAATFGEADGTISLAVVLSAVSAVDVTVDWSTADGTAVAGDDFDADAGVLTIPAGEMTGTVEVSLIDDAQPEDAESFSVILADPVGADLGAVTSSSITVTDDDAILSFLSFESDYTFVNEDVGTVELTVRLEPAANSEVSVRLATAGGAAVPGVDYTPVDQVLSFAPGEISQTITLAIIDDTTYESSSTTRLTNLRRV